MNNCNIEEVRGRLHLAEEGEEGEIELLSRGTVRKNVSKPRRDGLEREELVEGPVLEK